jgi:hypothetical protein
MHLQNADERWTRNFVAALLADLLGRIADFPVGKNEDRSAVPIVAFKEIG